MAAEAIPIQFEPYDDKKREQRIIRGLELNGIEADSIVAQCGHACVYIYKPDTDEYHQSSGTNIPNGKWEKLGVEGGLYICKKSFYKKK